MGVQHGFQIRAHFINRCVEGVLRRRTVNTLAAAVGFYTNNVLPGQCAFVHTCRGDPHISVIVHNGQIAAGGSGHSLVIDPLHEHDQLVCRVNVINIHNDSSVSIIS